MSMQLRYKGGFFSIRNTLYNVYIYQDGYNGEVSFVAFTDTPLTIEWPEVDKLEPIMSSSAKLQLYASSDRCFADLYTVKAGSIRLDVYRENNLYWSGTLDPELYEEPFAYLSDYGVELTFSDFAILDRKNFSLSGFKTLREIITNAIGLMDINCLGISEKISTKLFSGSSDNILDATSVQCQNYYDEDGDPMTMREALDETLRPFALKMIQKAGRLHVFDLNAMSNEDAAFVQWDSDDSTYSVDKVYNNVKLTYSPYEKTTLIEGAIDPETVTGKEITTWFSTAATSNDEIGFKTILSDTAKGLKKSDNAKYYRIVPVYSGDEEAGVAWTVETFASRSSGVYVNYLQEPTYNIGDLLFSIPETAFVANTGTTKDNYRLKISLKLLFDPRYNPFEEASKINEEGNWKEQQNRANFVYVPIKLLLKDDAGTVLYHYDNHAVKDSDSFANPGEKAFWKRGDAAWGDCFLCWYQGNRKNESGIGGWQTNKQIIGYYRGDLPALFDKRGTGELINLPPVSGYLEMQVGTGIIAYDYGREIKDSVYTQCRWFLYKDPKIEFVEKTGNTIATKDIEYSAWLNKDAEEGIKIETKLGTMPNPSQAALGQLYDTSSKTIRNNYYRAGVTDYLEKLLIGTVYSQYATPNIVLSGTAEIIGSFGTCKDKNETGNYIILSEMQDLRMDQSNIKMVQFKGDDYDGIKYY